VWALEYIIIIILGFVFFWDTDKSKEVKFTARDEGTNNFLPYLWGHVQYSSVERIVGFGLKAWSLCIHTNYMWGSWSM